MNLDDVRAEHRRLARVEAERVHGCTGDELVVVLLERTRYHKARAREIGQKHAAQDQVLQDLHARYRRLARLLNQPAEAS